MGYIDGLLDDIRHSVYILKKKKKSIMDGLDIVKNETAGSVVIDGESKNFIDNRVSEIEKNIENLEKMADAIDPNYGDPEIRRAADMLYKLSHFHSIAKEREIYARHELAAGKEVRDFHSEKIRVATSEILKSWRLIRTIKESHSARAASEAGHECCVCELQNELDSILSRRSMGHMGLEFFFEGEADEN